MARTLYIEDDKALGEQLIGKLKEAGYDAELVQDGLEGLQRAQQGKYDLVLLDILLPTMDGFAILKVLREKEATSKMPVLILSNLGSQEDFNKAQALGAESFLIKASVDPKQILDSIEQLLAFSEQ